MRIWVESYKAEVAYDEGDGIALDLELGNGQAIRFGADLGIDLAAKLEEQGAYYSRELANHARARSATVRELNELKTRVQKIELLYRQRTAGVLHADAVMAILGLPYEGGEVELCERRGSASCLDANCSKRLYGAMDGQPCHPVKERVDG